MPLIEVQWWPGVDARTRAEVAERLTMTMTDLLACPIEAVTVLFHEVAPTHWAKAGQLCASSRDDAPAPATPAAPAATAEEEVRAHDADRAA